jgi:hypothetical protein
MKDIRNSTFCAQGEYYINKVNQSGFSATAPTLQLALTATTGAYSGILPDHPVGSGGWGASRDRHGRRLRRSPNGLYIRDQLVACHQHLIHTQLHLGRCEQDPGQHGRGRLRNSRRPHPANRHGRPSGVLIRHPKRANTVLPSSNLAKHPTRASPWCDGHTRGDRTFSPDECTAGLRHVTSIRSAACRVRMLRVQSCCLSRSHEQSGASWPNRRASKLLTSIASTPLSEFSDVYAVHARASPRSLVGGWHALRVQSRKGCKADWVLRGRGGCSRDRLLHCTPAAGAERPKRPRLRTGPSHGGKAIRFELGVAAVQATG